MMCFRDMTFCSAKCSNRECFRNYNSEVREAGIRWWGSEDFPIALSNLSEGCGKYIPIRDIKAERLV
jgi:hypothetical protein